MYPSRTNKQTDQDDLQTEKRMSRSSSSNMSGSTKPKAAKLPVPDPTSIQKFLLIFLMHVCRKILLVDTLYKLAIYVVGIMVGSLFTDIFPFPPTYLSYKQNFLNQYLVKLGWGWTSSILAVYITLTSLTLTCGNWNVVIQKHLSRLGVGTLYWFFCTKFLNFIEHVSGVCSSGETDQHFTKTLCLSNGHNWLSLDLSGHAFLLVFCLLNISEEVKFFYQWDRIADILASEEKKLSNRLTREQYCILKQNYGKYTPYIKLTIVVLTVLQCVWEIMLIGTTLYFHNMPQKIGGVLFAALGWFLCYQVLYKSKLPFCPDMPGRTPLRLLKEY